jgi:hypothetical protein
LNRTEEFCKKATQVEILELFNTLSKALVKQFKIKEKSSLVELRTNFRNKKQHDSFYAKSFNDQRMYNAYLEDLKIVIKYIS